MTFIPASRRGALCHGFVEYVELALEEDFNDRFSEAMQFPHMFDEFPHLEGIIPRMEEVEL